MNDPAAVPTSLRIEVMDARLRGAGEARSAGSDGVQRREEAATQSVLVEALQGELARARDEVQRLSRSVRAEQLARLSAEQRAHAESAQRLNVTRRRNGGARAADRARQALSELAMAQARVREVETELVTARRQIDEAEHLAACASVARERAEALAARLGEKLQPPSAETGRAVDAAQHGRLLALERQLTARRVQQAARAMESEARLAAHEQLSRRVESTLAELRGQLDWLRGALGREGEARRDAECRALALQHELERRRQRARVMQEAVAELRQMLEPLLPEPVVQSHPAGNVEATAEVQAGNVEATSEVQAGNVKATAEVQADAGVASDLRLTDALLRLQAAVAPLDADDPLPAPARRAEHADPHGGRGRLSKMIGALERLLHRWIDRVPSG